jgi:hydroxyacylglutathione hydrolase
MATQSEIKVISAGGVNCYLVKSGNFYYMIDTGFAHQRKQVEKELQNAGCRPGNLKLILITHGDSDHTGNAAYLRAKYGAKIAIHPGEAEVVERGNMIFSRKHRSWFAKVILSFFKLAKSNRFKPDVLLADGQDLTELGLDARVWHIPGHSSGSIGILTATGDLFCGDLLINQKGRPAINSLIDDPQEADASVEKLKRFAVKTVYPGHGEPFPMEQLLEAGAR